MKCTHGSCLTLAALLILHAGAGIATEPAVKITPELAGIVVDHQGQDTRIERNQDPSNIISSRFRRTSRKCPPFCIQPMQLPGGVETIGEIEMLKYLQRRADGDESVLIIDSRGPISVKGGTIPGAENLHYKQLSLRSTDDAVIAGILEDRFGAKRNGELWNFRNAKTLVMFCNGAWCGQSPTNIRSLMRFGYPPSKIKWYRGGMQAWETLGLTTVVPKSE